MVRNYPTICSYVAFGMFFFLHRVLQEILVLKESRDPKVLRLVTLQIGSLFVLTCHISHIGVTAITKGRPFPYYANTKQRATITLTSWTS